MYVPAVLGWWSQDPLALVVHLGSYLGDISGTSRQAKEANITAKEAVAAASAEGLDFQRSSINASGYEGVCKRAHGGYEATAGVGLYLGVFRSAEGAALAIARFTRAGGGSASVAGESASSSAVGVGAEEEEEDSGDEDSDFDDGGGSHVFPLPRAL